MNKNVKIALAVTVATMATSVSAIPTEVSDALTTLGTEIATYTGPAVILAVAVSTAVIAVKWTKRFISRAT